MPRRSAATPSRSRTGPAWVHATLPRWISAAALLVALTCGGCAHRAERVIVLATTTSVANSGLLDVLEREFARQHGVSIRTHQAGSGRSLRMLENGQADVAISHAPAAEARVLAGHPGWHYRKFMFNHFVVVGPLNDPAGVSTAKTIDEAMRRIAASTSRFVSRGDESGTHERERELWAHAGAQPGPDRLLASGQGMANTLRVASSLPAYTLTDRPTFLALQSSVALRIVFEDDDALVNTYSIVVPVGDGAAQALRDARLFADWLVSEAGRTTIASFTVGGVQPFRVWP